MNLIGKVFNKIYHTYLGIDREAKQRAFYDKTIHSDLGYECEFKNKKVLIIGVYLTDYENQAEHLIEQYSRSKRHIVDQKWIAIGKNNPPDNLIDSTIFHSKDKIPKFKLLNDIIKKIDDIDSYDYLIISDDDVVVHDNFIDIYIDLIEKFKIKLAQPARVSHSYNVHRIVLEDKKSLARITNFVEIGPIFSFHKSIFRSVIPFPESAQMGWGLDFIWPEIGRNNNFNLGIVDLVPVDHSYRPQSKTYSNDSNKILMHKLLTQYENNFGDNLITLERIKR